MLSKNLLETGFDRSEKLIKTLNTGIKSLGKPADFVGFVSPLAPQILLKSVRICLYRVNTSFSIPYIEFLMTNKTEFPICDTSKTAYTFINFTTKIKNQILHYIVNTIFQSVSSLSNNGDFQPPTASGSLVLPKFKGFYPILNESPVTASADFVDFASSHPKGETPQISQYYAFYEIISSPSSPKIKSDFHWLIYDQINTLKNPITHFDFHKIYKNDEEITVQPILVYGKNDKYLRYEHNLFGYFFHFKKNRIPGEFDYPHLLFPPSISETFFILKYELQNIKSEYLLNYDFSNYYNIKYIENKNESWCIKNILTFFPIPDNDSDDKEEDEQENDSIHTDDVQEDDTEDSIQTEDKQDELKNRKTTPIEFFFGNPFAQKKNTSLEDRNESDENSIQGLDSASLGRRSRSSSPMKSPLEPPSSSYKTHREQSFHSLSHNREENSKDYDLDLEENSKDYDLEENSKDYDLDLEENSKDYEDLWSQRRNKSDKVRRTL